MTWEQLIKPCCYLYKVLSVPGAVQMLILNVVLLPYCFRAKLHAFPIKPKQNRGCVFSYLQMWQMTVYSLARSLAWWKHKIRPPFLTMHSLTGWGEPRGSAPPHSPPGPCSRAPRCGLQACAQKLPCRCPVLPGSSCPSNLACNFPASVRAKKSV